MNHLLKNLAFSGVALLVSLTLAAVSYSGVFMETTMRTHGEPGTTVVKSYVNPDRVRMETQGQDTDFITIFRADKRLLWQIDQRSRTYMEMTEATMTGMAAQMQQMMQEMERQMGQLPPEQRRMMEEMMRAQRQSGPSSGPRKISVRRLATGERVGSFTTDRYEVLENGEKSSEVWVVPWPSLGLAEQDFRALEELAKMMEAMAGPFKEMARRYGSDLQIEKEVKGLPVKTLGYEKGRPTFEALLNEIRRESLPSSLFELPSGLRKGEMAPMR